MGNNGLGSWRERGRNRVPEGEIYNLKGHLAIATAKMTSGSNKNKE